MFFLLNFRLGLFTTLIQLRSIRFLTAYAENISQCYLNKLAEFTRGDLSITMLS